MSPKKIKTFFMASKASRIEQVEGEINAFLARTDIEVLDILQSGAPYSLDMYLGVIITIVYCEK